MRGQRVPLQPRPFDRLVYLIVHRDRVVTKSELMSVIWSGDAVVPDVLTSAMHSVRRALGEHGRMPRYVRTVHRVGYQWVAPVETRSLRESTPSLLLFARAGEDESVRLEAVDAANTSCGSEVVSLSGSFGAALLQLLADRLQCECSLDAVRERLVERPVVLSIEPISPRRRSLLSPSRPTISTPEG